MDHDDHDHDLHQQQQLHVIPIQPDQVSAHWICAICLTIPLRQPLLTPCQHVFCHDCMRRHYRTTVSISAASSSFDCPTCRSQLAQDLTALASNSFLYRIWSDISVKCGNYERGCPWTGPMVDASAHVQACDYRMPPNHNGRSIELLQQELDACQTRCAVVTADLAEANAKIEQRNADARAMQQRIDDLNQQLRTLQSLRDSRTLVPKIFYGTYDFDHHSIVPLSQLISRHVEIKPENFDANKIYTCVRRCYLWLERRNNRDANVDSTPEGYSDDVRMLLAICVASNWFSDKQDANMKQWMRTRNWL